MLSFQSERSLTALTLWSLKNANSTGTEVEATDTSTRELGHMLRTPFFNWARAQAD